MGIIVVEHNDINAKIVKQYLYGSTKKKGRQPKHKDKKKNYFEYDLYLPVNG